MLTTSIAGIRLIEEYEGLRLSAYRDCRGIPTIGYGHTLGVQMGQTCTREQAEVWLRSDVATAEAAVRRLVTVSLSQCQFDALVSFTFNLGCGNLGRSDVLRHTNAGEIDAAAGCFSHWNMAGGRVESGLVRRRAAEAAMFSGSS